MSFAPLLALALTTPAPLFLTHKSIKVGPMTGRPAVADVNRDGKADIVVACGPCCGSPTSPESGHVVVLLGKGDGDFTWKDRIKVNPSARKVALGDLNGDGVLDMAVASHDTYELDILIGDGKGGFTKGKSVASAQGTKPHTHEVTIADVNKDGKNDLFATNATDGTISVLIGDGKGGFTPAAGSPFQVARHPYDALAVRDMNGDGHVDVVVPDLAANAVRVIFGNGTGLFTKENRASITVGERPGYLLVEDFDKDGRPDIIASHDDVPLVNVILNKGGGSFAQAPNSAFKVHVPGYLWGMASADFNGDGRMDVAFGNVQGKGVVIMTGKGNGEFELLSESPFQTDGAPEQLAVGDFNGDGRMDIVTGNYSTGSITVLMHS
jgi:hypothetical protein